MSRFHVTLESCDLIIGDLQNAVEEKVLERAAQKLRLDQLVIQQGRAQQNTKGSAIPMYSLGFVANVSCFQLLTRTS